VELACPCLGVVSHLSFHHPPVADFFCWGRIGIYDRLNDPVSTKNYGRPDGQDAAGPPAFGLVLEPRVDPAGLELGPGMLQHVRGDRNDPGDVIDSRTRSRPDVRQMRRSARFRSMS